MQKRLYFLVLKMGLFGLFLISCSTRTIFDQLSSLEENNYDSDQLIFNTQVLGFTRENNNLYFANGLRLFAKFGDSPWQKQNFAQETRILDVASVGSQIYALASNDRTAELEIHQASSGSQKWSKISSKPNQQAVRFLLSLNSSGTLNPDIFVYARSSSGNNFLYQLNAGTLQDITLPLDAQSHTDLVTLKIIGGSSALLAEDRLWIGSGLDLTSATLVALPEINPTDHFSDLFEATLSSGSNILLLSRRGRIFSTQNLSTATWTEPISNISADFFHYSFGIIKNILVVTSSYGFFELNTDENKLEFPTERTVNLTSYHSSSELSTSGILFIKKFNNDTYFQTRSKGLWLMNIDGNFSQP